MHDGFIQRVIDELAQEQAGTEPEAEAKPPAGSFDGGPRSSSSAGDLDTESDSRKVLEAVKSLNDPNPRFR